LSWVQFNIPLGHLEDDLPATLLTESTNKKPSCR